MMVDMKNLKKKYSRLIKRLDKCLNDKLNKKKYRVIDEIYEGIREILNNLPMICVFYGSFTSELGFDNINDIDVLILMERKYKPSLFKIIDLKRTIRENILSPKEIDAFFFPLEEITKLKKSSALLKELSKGIHYILNGGKS